MKVSLDYDSQYMEQYKMFQTTNQIYIYIISSPWELFNALQVTAFLRNSTVCHLGSAVANCGKRISRSIHMERGEARSC